MRAGIRHALHRRHGDGCRKEGRAACRRRPSRNKRRLRKPANTSARRETTRGCEEEENARRGIGLGLLGVAGIIALSAIISVHTSKGTLEIETDDPNVQVAVKQNGEVVEVVDAKSGWKISLKSGEYELAPQGSTDQFQLDKNSVVVKRGDTVKVKVTLKPPVNLRFQI